jgi:hypothetical protein
MSIELTYVALRRLTVGGQPREKGELVPEAATWHNIDAYIRGGRIAPVPISAVDADELAKAEAAWQQRIAEKNQDEEAPAEPVDELEQYHTGSGWYEVPGSDKKLRRDEAQAFLEGGEE